MVTSEMLQMVAAVSAGALLVMEEVDVQPRDNM